MPRRILVDLPDAATREAILKVSLSGNRLAPDVNLTQVLECERVCDSAGKGAKSMRVRVRSRCDQLTGTRGCTPTGGLPTGIGVRVVASRHLLLPSSLFLCAKVALQLEGYTGSDIKEVCREAVVHVAHEVAGRLERAESPSEEAHLPFRPQPRLEQMQQQPNQPHNKDSPQQPQDCAGVPREEFAAESLFALRPVARLDLERALRKLSASVNERGREVGRVLEWNDQYGEVKKPKKRSASSLYL